MSLNNLYKIFILLTLVSCANPFKEEGSKKQIPTSGFDKNAYAPEGTNNVSPFGSEDPEKEKTKLEVIAHTDDDHGGVIKVEYVEPFLRTVRNGNRHFVWNKLKAILDIESDFEHYDIIEGMIKDDALTFGGDCSWLEFTNLTPNDSHASRVYNDSYKEGQNPCYGQEMHTPFTAFTITRSAAMIRSCEYIVSSEAQMSKIESQYGSSFSSEFLKELIENFYPKLNSMDVNELADELFSEFQAEDEPIKVAIMTFCLDPSWQVP